MLSTIKLELLEAILANPKMSDVKLAELLHLNNKTVGKYRKEPEFQQELKRRLMERWKGAENLAQSTMLELCENGDFKAAKYILDSLDYAPTQKIDATVSQDIVINIGD